MGKGDSPDEAMWEAAFWGDEAALRSALESGASPARGNPSGLMAGHLAALKGSAGCLRILADFGWNPDSEDPGGERAIHFAARRGNLAAVEELLSQGASANAKTAEGETPLRLAARKALSLLGRGADEAARESAETALRLIKAGANPLQKGLAGVSEVEMARQEWEADFAEEMTAAWEKRKMTLRIPAAVPGRKRGI